jgi:biopolymer transport protein ExbD
MSSRRHQEHAPGGVNLGLIVTPMLDMSFQILSFFIMTYHPSALEGHIPGSLAPPEQVATKAPQNNPLDIIPPSVPEDMLLPEVQEAMTVIVKTGGAAGAGLPDKILLKRKVDPTPMQIADTSTNKWDRAREDLGKELKRIRKEAGIEQGNIKIEADGDLQQEYVMQVYDTCKSSGFSKIHFVPPPLLRQAKD